MSQVILMLRAIARTQHVQRARPRSYGYARPSYKSMMHGCSNLPTARRLARRLARPGSVSAPVTCETAANACEVRLITELLLGV